MLQKLQHRFILINMVLVGVVIVSVIFGICINTYRDAINDISTALTQSMKAYENGDMSRPNIGGGGSAHKNNNDKLGSVATVTVVCDDSGKVSSVYQKYGSINDENLTTAVNAALSADNNTGRVKSLNLAYYKASSGNDNVIVFADTYTVIMAAKAQNTSSVLMGGAALFILLLISILLSKIVLRPVEKAWVQQQQFVADASHELKTPLTVILANNDILMSPGHVNDTVTGQKQWIESTQAEANHMKKLVDNLLFLARSDAADAASQKIICSDVSWSDTIMDIYLQFEPVAFEKGVLIDADIERDTKVNGDPTQLKQLAHILIDNAIKYAGDGGRIFVKVASKGSVVDFSVNNTGEPIPKEDIGHIFERFYRADKARTQEGGYGLGLAIAKSIVEKHGGVITCRSTESEGTTFTATLPLASGASKSRFKRGQKVKAVKPQAGPGTVSSADSSAFSSSRIDSGPPEGVLDADYEIKEAPSEPSIIPPSMPPLSNSDTKTDTDEKGSL